MNCIAEGDIEVMDLWEEGDGAQEVMLYKRPILKVLRELVGDERLAARLVRTGVVRSRASAAGRNSTARSGSHPTWTVHGRSIRVNWSWAAARLVQTQQVELV